MTSGMSALARPAFISCSLTPVSPHQAGPNAIGEYHRAPSACLTMTQTRIAHQLIGNSCMMPSPASRPRHRRGKPSEDNNTRSARKFLVLDALGDDRIGAEPAHLVLLVVLEIALEPFDVTVALEREYVGGDAVQKPAVVADDHGAAG